MRGHRLGLVLLAVSLIVAGCQSRTATVLRSNGQEYEGKILGRQGDQLIIEQGTAKTRGAVPVDEVVDIDHPGNVDLIVGSAIGAVGLWPLITGVVVAVFDDPVEDASGVTTNANEVAGTVLIVIGLAMVGTGAYLAISGGLNWQASREAAERELAPAGVALGVVPWIDRGLGGDLRGGLGLAMQF